MELALERSPLSDRLVAPELAFEHHLDTFARWLRAAGAEARLAVVYVSGPAARAELARGLEARRCRVVDTPARPGTPVHATLAAHQGDHFNDLLHCVDLPASGEADLTRVMREIGLQIATFRRVATWVAVVVDSLEGLAALEAAGGILRRHAQRRFLFLSPADPRPLVDPVPAEAVARWQLEHRIAERTYHLALAPEAAPTCLDFARFVRTGYAGLPLRAGAHADLVAMRHLWETPPADAAAAAPWVARPSPAVAEMLARWRPALLGDPQIRTSVAMALAADPVARFAVGLPVADSPALEALDRLRRAADGGAVPTPAQLAPLEGARGDLGPGLAVHVALHRAAVAVAEGEIGACQAALEEAEARLAEHGIRLAPELIFEVVEKHTGLQAAMGQRGDARAGLDRLGDLLPRLHSPYWAARHALARGEQTLPLDPARGREALREAAVTFHEHGWDTWAAMARATAESAG